MNPAQDFLAFFNFDQVWPALEQFRSRLGSPTSGTLGAMLITFFMISLVWGWVKNKFDTWVFWDLFLRLFVVAAGILAWHTVFVMVDSSMNWLATAGNTLDPYGNFTDLLFTPFDNLVIGGNAWGAFSAILPGVAIMGAIEGLLEILVIAAFCLSVLGQHILVLVLYCLGPFFLVTWLFDPLSDLWMRWVRAYVTLKLWLMIIYISLFVLAATATGQQLNSAFSAAQSLVLPFVYLIFLLILIGASFPLARALVGAAISPAVSGSMVPGMAAVAGGAVLTAGGMAAGAAVGGPVGAGVGGGIGGAAGKAGGTAINPPGRQ